MTLLCEIAERVRYWREPCGAYPWWAELDGNMISGPPEVIDHPKHGLTVVMGKRRFKTRRQARAAVAALLAMLESSR